MTLDQAKAFKMPHGNFKDVELGRIPLPYLKWIAKNWVRKELRDAALMVVNSRSVEIQEKPTFKPTFNSSKLVRKVEKIDYSQGFTVEMKAFLDSQPEGLF